jgi:hypothetical protein
LLAFGGLKTGQVNRLKDLEAENARLKLVVANLSLEQLILKEAAGGHFWSARVAAYASSTSIENRARPSVAPMRRWVSRVRYNTRTRETVTTKNG